MSGPGDGNARLMESWMSSRDIEFPALDPATGEYGTPVRVTPRRQEMCTRRSKGAVAELAYLVSEALKSPNHIYEGIRWNEDDDSQDSDGWRCYCLKPEFAFNNDGERRPAYEGEVFLVFVNTDRVAYNWRWEKCHEFEPSHVQRFETRFHQLIHP
jgi:hypothetical protein